MSQLIDNALTGQRINVPGVLLNLATGDGKRIAPYNDGAQRGFIDQLTPPADTYPRNGTVTQPDPPSDPTIDYSFAIFPWGDSTHLFIQEEQVVWLSRHIDAKTPQMGNMLPIFKMNYEQIRHHINLRNSQAPLFVEFRELLEEFGESVLFNCQWHENHDLPIDNGRLARFYALAKRQVSYSRSEAERITLLSKRFV